MEVEFLSIVIGLPLAICVVALLGAHFHREGNERLLDWVPTRSAETEARLDHGEVEQMLGAVNRYRRMRGLPERSLQEITRAER